MMRSGFRRLAAVVALNGLLLALAVPARAADVTLTMDELPFQPINGLSFMGVTFGFTVDSLPSDDAHYNASGPGQITYVQDPSIEGTTTGTLQVDFATPTPYVNFGAALSTLNPVSPGFSVDVYDENGVLVGSFPIDTQPLITFSEALFSYSGTLVSRIVVTFNSFAAIRFAFDNLNYDDGIASAHVGGQSAAPGAGSAGWHR